MDKVIVIGIAGGTGSGKSTMIRKIKEETHVHIQVRDHNGGLVYALKHH